MINFYKAAVVIQNIPKSATPLVDHHLNFIYIRFHGPTGNYRDSYSEDFLNEHTTNNNEWRKEGRTVDGYFNNSIGNAFKNLKTLNFLIRNKISMA